MAAGRMLPDELSALDRKSLIAGLIDDVLVAVANAIGADLEHPPAKAPVQGDEAQDETEGSELEALRDDVEGELFDKTQDKLLDRLLSMGVLPRYAFPTDVAAFYVFDEATWSSFKPRMKFAPTQALNVALSQYAPNKQIWINNKQYTSKAVYSPYRDERSEAWSKRKLFFECSRCGHARTDEFSDERKNATFDCEACKARRINSAWSASSSMSRMRFMDRSPS